MPNETTIDRQARRVLNEYLIDLRMLQDAVLEFLGEFYTPEKIVKRVMKTFNHLEK